MEATWWLNEHLQEWLGEKNAADTLTQSVPNNVTSEMGLALLDVADVIRPHPEVVAFLRSERRRDDGFLDELAAGRGRARGARDAIEAFLDEYGMRCVGEIDITRPRWSERPATLVSDDPRQRQELRARRGRAALRAGTARGRGRRSRSCWSACGPCRTGEQKADETKRMIDRVRTFTGYREYPKYGMVSRYFVYKQALLRGGRAPRAGRRAARAGGHLLPPLRGAPRGRAHAPGGRTAHPRAQGGVPVVPGAHAAAGAHLRRRGRHRCVPARRPAGRRARSAWRSPPAPSRGGPA